MLLSSSVRRSKLMFRYQLAHWSGTPRSCSSTRQLPVSQALVIKWPMQRLNVVGIKLWTPRVNASFKPLLMRQQRAGQPSQLHIASVPCQLHKDCVLIVAPVVDRFSFAANAPISSTLCRRAAWWSKGHTQSSWLKEA